MKPIAALLLLLVSPLASADIYNRQLVPLGEREAFMANTGTGDAADTGAVYYNPAALAETDSSKVSVLGSVYLSFSTKTDSVGVIDGKNIPLEASGFNTIPATYVAASQWQGWHYALSVLVPESLQFENRLSFTTPNTKGNVLTSSRSEDLWIGLTGAHVLSDDWSLGFTLFGIRHFESLISGTVVNVTTVNNSLVSQVGRTSISAFGLSAIGGLAYRPTEWLGLGLRIQSPFLEVSAKGDSYFSNNQVQEGVLTLTEEDKKDVEANYRLPLDMTLGAAFHLDRYVDLLVDTSFQVGATYDSIPGAAGSTSYDADPTFRFNTGVDFKFIRSFPISLGFFYNPSAFHGFKSDQTGQARSDFLGFTLGATYVSEHIETGAGFFYFIGNGETNPTQSTTDLVDVSTRYMGALISTAYVF